MPIKRDRPSVKLEPRAYDTDGLPTRYFNPGELDALLCLYESVRPEVVIEFGVNTGRNVVAALRNIPSIKRYIGVDVPVGYQTRMTVQRGEVPEQPGYLAKNDPRFELVIRPRGTFDLTKEELPRADAIFIDADHSRVGVENDYKLAKQLINPGGVIIFHDDNGLPVVEVTQTLNDFVKHGSNIVHVEGTWLAFERFPYEQESKEPVFTVEELIKATLGVKE